VADLFSIKDQKAFLCFAVAWVILRVQLSDWGVLSKMTAAYLKMNKARGI